MKKKNPENYIYLLAGLVFLTGIILLSYFSFQYFVRGRSPISLIVSQKLAEQPVGNIECDYQRILDGVCVDSVDKINPELVAVMIENHYEARPQAGLASASIVYEAPVEANYTRFMAIYPVGDEVNKIGPVRSARPYYLDWLAEYGTPLYMHVGGSPDALNIIKSRNIFDLNEFYRGWFYWRADGRSAPHNVYTSSKLWEKALLDYTEDYEDNKYEGWSFVTTSPDHLTTLPPDHTVTDITVSFLPPVYEAVWKYSSTTNKYGRYQMGETHVDDDGTNILADNVIVQKVSAKVLDEVGRQEITTIGKGDLLVFKNGGVLEGYWEKSGAYARTKFYYNNSNEIRLNPGKTWVEIVSQFNSVSY